MDLQHVVLADDMRLHKDYTALYPYELTIFYGDAT